MGLALVWSNGATHEELVPSATFRRLDTGAPSVETTGARGWHSAWRGYVTGVAGEPASEASWFTRAEYSHMADVRGVFVGAQLAGLVALVLAAVLIARGRRRGHALRLVRDGATIAGFVVLAIGLIAGLAFEAAFLAFHQVFFPQGNFLFAPGSNLLALYPQEYFYGLTVRIAVSFLTLAATGAALAQFALRGARNTA